MRVAYGKKKEELSNKWAKARDVYLDGEWAGTLTTWYDECEDTRYRVCEYSFLGYHAIGRPYVSISIDVDPDKNEARKKLAELKKKIKKVICE